MIRCVLCWFAFALVTAQVPCRGQSPLTMKLAPNDTRAGQYFGYSVALKNQVLVAGALYDDAVASAAGAAYVLEREGDSWSQRIRLVKEMPMADELFGYDVATDGETVAVSAVRESTGGIRLGAVYVYRRVEGAWSLQQRLLPGNRFDEGFFGGALIFAGDALIVGAPAEGGTGAVYVFEELAGSWSESDKLTTDDPETGLGTSLAVDGTTLVAGAAAYAGQQGAAYVFENTGDVWLEQQRLVASDGIHLERFGNAVAIRGDTIAVGVAQDRVVGEDSGSVYFFDRVGGSWTEGQFLTPSDAAPRQRFGSQITFHGETLVISSAADSHSGISRAGSVYRFRRQDETWVEEKKWVSGDPQDSQFFGYELAADGEDLIIGAHGDSDGGTFSGAIYGTRGIFADGFESGDTSRW